MALGRSAAARPVLRLLLAALGGGGVAPARSRLALPLFRTSVARPALSLAAEPTGPQVPRGLPLRTFWNNGQRARNVTTKIYVEVNLGTPPQTFRLSPDTGSAYLAVPSASCSACSPSLHRYKEALSLTAVPVPCDSSLCQICDGNLCGAQVRYVDGSGFDAKLVSDIFDSGVRVTFGTIIQELERGNVPFQPPDVDGIWGLAYSSLAHGQPTIFDQLVSSGMVPRDIFAVSIGREGQQGMLFLGGEGEQLHGGPVLYTPIISQTFYVVHLEAVLVDGHRLNVPPSIYNEHQTIVDSGTTNIVLPAVAYEALKSTMLARCRDKPLVGVCSQLHDNDASKSLFENYCYIIDVEELSAFPTLSFQMPKEGGGSFLLDVQPSLYLRHDPCEDPSAWALAVTKPLGPEGSTVLGDALMAGFVVVHDRGAGRLGFAPVAGAGELEPTGRGQALRLWERRTMSSYISSALAVALAVVVSASAAALLAYTQRGRVLTVASPETGYAALHSGPAEQPDVLA